MNVTKPTAEDMARDLAGDLAFHTKATPGLWIAFTSPGGALEGEVHAHQGSDLDGRLTHVLSTPEGDERDDDIRFAAEAHEGWPVAIRRALWAEAELAKWHADHESLAAYFMQCVRDDAGELDMQATMKRQEESWCLKMLEAQAEAEKLREMYARACDRIAGQSELLGRRAEK
jgi:hypothetical protein